MAAKTVKMCDVSKEIAADVFSKLNKGKIIIEESCGKMRICTETEPKDLVYPEGWYYAKGTFRNKHNSTTGIYEEIPMCRSSKEPWSKYVSYSTQDADV